MPPGMGRVGGQHLRPISGLAAVRGQVARPARQAGLPTASTVSTGWLLSAASGRSVRRSPIIARLPRVRIAVILETVVTTQSAAGVAHIAPMGIRRTGERVEIAPFAPSTTLENLRATGAAVINAVDDVRIVAGCLTGRRDWPLVPAGAVPRLAAALAHAEIVIESVDEDAERPRFQGRIVREAQHAPFSGYNRAQAAVIEAAILVSRLERLPAEKIAHDIAYLRIAVDKTAGPREREAWDWLLERIEAFRRERGHAA